MKPKPVIKRKSGGCMGLGNLTKLILRMKFDIIKRGLREKEISFKD